MPGLLVGGGAGGIAAQPVKNFAVSRLASTFAQRAAEKAIVVGGVNFGAGIAGDWRGDDRSGDAGGHP